MENNFLEVTPLVQRKEFGQFFTPEIIAHPMVRWVTYSYRTPNLLDAGVGTGVFVANFLKARRESRIAAPVSIDCIDVDSHVLTFAKRAITAQPSEQISFIKHDFLRFKTDTCYSSIISNPPYYKHHYINDKADTVSTVKELTGFDLPITTNIYCLFMFRARALMATPGRCAFIVPSEFLNADYGVKVKEHLANDPAFKGIIIFNFKTLVFDDALTTACIVLFDTDKETSQEVRFVSLGDPELLGAAFEVFNNATHEEPLFANAPVHTFTYKREELDASRKWKNYVLNRGVRKSHKHLAPLAKYASCSRGIATGANDYFTFSESKRLELGIAKEDTLFCLAKSSDVPTYIFDTHDLNNLITGDSRIYLLNPRAPLSMQVKKYLEYGESEGINKRYLPAHRDTWYLPERQRPAEIWVMVFSRGRTRFVWNRAGINHLTTFHGIYPSLFGKTFLAPLLLYLWSDACQQIMEEQQRQYGNGLKKYEPRDIEKVLVPDFEQGDQSWIDEAELILEKIKRAHLENAPVNGTNKEIEDYLLRTWLQGEKG